MSVQDRRSEWTVIVGIGLVILGAWLLLERFAGWAIAPIQFIFGMLARVGWPLLLIGLGVLFIIRARGGGWAPSGRPLYRARMERVVAGVLGGLANWLGVNPTPLRVIFVILALITGVWAGFLAYILAAVLIPEEPVGYPAPAARGYASPQTGWVSPTAPPPPAPPAPPVPPAPVAPDAAASTPPVPPNPPAPPA